MYALSSPLRGDLGRYRMVNRFRREDEKNARMMSNIRLDLASVEGAGEAEDDTVVVTSPS